MDKHKHPIDKTADVIYKNRRTLFPIVRSSILHHLQQNLKKWSSLDWRLLFI